MLLMLRKYYIDPCQTNFHLLISIPPYNKKYHYQESDGSTRKNGWRKIEVMCVDMTFVWHLLLILCSFVMMMSNNNQEND